MTLTCLYCEKTFDKESSQRRHHYYCRTKQPQPDHYSRRRSCKRCSRDKARCDCKTPQCSRCKEKGVDCQYNIVSPKNASWDEATAAKQQRQDKRVVAVAWPQCTDVVKAFNLVPSSHAKSPLLPDQFDYGYKDMDLTLLDGWELDGGLSGNMGLDFGSIDYGAYELSLVESSSPTPQSLVLPVMRLFGPRSSITPTQRPIVSIILQLLKSYPYMLLHKETFPPFISPFLYTWAEQGSGPPLKALINCVSLVQMFTMRTATNRKVVWNLIRLEQERIWSQHTDFDRWELLAALQSLLVYCLLRIAEGETEENEFDFPLLTTVKFVGAVLADVLGGPQAVETPEDRDVEWREWLFNESQRRTLLVFKTVNFFIDLGVAMTCSGKAGFALLPLPYSTSLWKASTAESWRDGFEQTYQERTIYGLSISGELIRLRQKPSGIDSTVAEWEEWHAGMGEIGTLITITASLFRDVAYLK